MPLLFWGTAALFLLTASSALRQLRWVKRLPALRDLDQPALPESPNDGIVRCSVVIAARDEEARIEETIRLLLAQRGVEIDLIVVDDRSTDRTGEILRRWAERDSRVRIRRVDVLPDGWLGKCHACHTGAGAAAGDWILFTDADCWLKPDLLLRAVRGAERAKADHVTLVPGTILHSVWARAWHLLFLTSLLNWFSGVNRDRPKSYIGVGAFNLVRASAYRDCGGYEALRLTVVDDLKLGLLLRRAGKRTRAFLGVDDVQCHWGSTVRNMVQVLEKNYFAALDYRTPVVLAGSAFMILVFCILALGLATGTAAGLAAGLSPFLLTLPAAILARRLGWALPSAVCMPLMFPVFFYALVNSTWVT
ncbi:MAG TPA: glycosyltransferase family 2 protein, partial [Verrucomicrobiales bacterium]|nr:glycosyltransferase family 2 protein [Verrucomicrobiales bacterium]